MLDPSRWIGKPRSSNADGNAVHEDPVVDAGLRQLVANGEAGMTRPDDDYLDPFRHPATAGL